MKTQLIMLDTPIIVSDEDLKEGDKGYNFKDNRIITISPGWNNSIDLGVKKIIAGLPNLPKIDWNGLEKEFGYVDIEELAQQIWLDPKSHLTSRNSFVQGFKASQKLNDKKFSKEDMKAALERGYSCGSNNFSSSEFDKEIKEFIQPKVFDIKTKMESVHTDHVPGGFEYFIKIVKKL